MGTITIARIEITDSTGEPLLTFDEPNEDEMSEAVRRFIELYEDEDADPLCYPSITRYDSDESTGRGHYNPDFKSFRWEY